MHIVKSQHDAMNNDNEQKEQYSTKMMINFFRLSLSLSLSFSVARRCVRADCAQFFYLLLHRLSMFVCVFVFFI